MPVQTVEKIELFSETELESLQFLPEELAGIESELYPDLDSISLEEVASDLEAYFVEDIEEVELERFGFLKRLFRRGSRGNASTPVRKWSRRKLLRAKIYEDLAKIKDRDKRKRYRKRFLTALSTGANLAVLIGLANQLRKDIKAGK